MTKTGDAGQRSGEAVVHVVEQGECMSVLAEASGHFWERLWNHPDNASLQRLRHDPNVLMPGDRVVVPAIMPKDVSVATGRRHVFRRKGVPCYLRVRFVKGDGTPRAHERFKLMIDGAERTGSLDADGWLVASLPRAARRGELTLDSGLSCELDLGSIDPVDAPSGFVARLSNLGYAVDFAGDLEAELTRGAIRSFQADSGLPETGVADDATRQALKDRYGA